MIPLFLGLTAANILFLAAAAAMGYAGLSSPTFRPYHPLAGALAARGCVAVHCVVFTYFIATAKWVQHAVSVKRLDPALTAPTRSFRAQAFPAALLAIAAVFVAAIYGAYTDAYARDPAVHHVLALAAIAINLIVASIEYRAIARNAALIDMILAQINTPPAAS